MLDIASMVGEHILACNVLKHIVKPQAEALAIELADRHAEHLLISLPSVNQAERCLSCTCPECWRLSSGTRSLSVRTSSVEQLPRPRAARHLASTLPCQPCCNTRPADKVSDIISHSFGQIRGHPRLLRSETDVNLLRVGGAQRTLQSSSLCTLRSMQNTATDSTCSALRSRSSGGVKEVI